MESTLISFVHQLGTLEFWEALLEGFGDSGWAKSQVLDESHDAETVFCGNSVYTAEIFVNILAQEWIL